MLEMILTNSLDSRAILERMKERYRRGRKMLLIVPDRFTLSYERALLDFLQIEGTFDIEVVSFSRLADKTLDSRIHRLLDNQSEVMLLRKVIEECKDRLVYYKNAAQFTGFAAQMYAAISQIRNSGVSAEALERACETLSDKTANKTKDIALVYRGYVAALQDKYTDGSSKLEALTEEIEQGRYGEYEVYISDYTGMTQIEYGIVGAMMRACRNVCICVLDGSDAAGNPYPNEHIYPFEMQKKIRWLAQNEAGSKLHVSRRFFPLPDRMQRIAQYLFSYRRPGAKLGGEECVRLIAAPDPEEEVKQTARDITRLVKKSGARYRDIAVVCCDVDRYRDAIDGIFRRFSIPYYLDVKTPLAKQAVVTLLSDAMSAAESRYAARDMIALAKQPLMGIDYAHACAFENYCLEYRMEYSRFEAEFSIGEGLERDTSEQVRKTLMSALRPIRRKEGTVGEFCAGVREFLTHNEIRARNEAYVSDLVQTGYEAQSEIARQSYDRIVELLDRFDAMMGDVRLQTEEFRNIFASAIDSVKLSGVPLLVDCVFIGGNKDSRYENLDHMFVIGANEGKFPTEHTDTGMIAERESRAWEERGIVIQPDVRSLNQNEKLTLLTTVIKPRKSLTVSYSDTDGAGAPVLPSSVIEYLSELLGCSVQNSERMRGDWSVAQYAEYCGARPNALGELLTMVGSVKKGEWFPSDREYAVMDVLYGVMHALYRQSHAEYSYVDALLEGEYRLQDNLDACADLAWKGDYLSASQLEKYFACPLAHFIQYTLRAKRRREAGMRADETGDILHAIMESYFRRPDCAELDERQIDSVVRETLRAIIADQQRYRALSDTAEGKRAFDSIGRRASFMIRRLVEKMVHTSFRPKWIEESFGFPDSRRSGVLVSGKHPMTLRGRIDRVDEWDNRIIIVDYKSKSSIRFSAAEILYGERVQMFTYLSAMLQDRLLEPAGVFYLLMSDKMVKEDDSGDRFAFRGFVAAEESELQAFDDRLSAPTYASDIFPIVKKNGKQSGSAATDRQTLRELCDYVLRLAAKAVSEIDGGFVKATPIVTGSALEPSACRFCDYKNACNISSHPEQIRRGAGTVALETMTNSSKEAAK